MNTVEESDHPSPLFTTWKLPLVWELDRYQPQSTTAQLAAGSRQGQLRSWAFAFRRTRQLLPFGPWVAVSLVNPMENIIHLRCPEHMIDDTRFH